MSLPTSKSIKKFLKEVDEDVSFLTIANLLAFQTKKEIVSDADLSAFLCDKYDSPDFFIAIKGALGALNRDKALKILYRQRIERNDEFFKVAAATVYLEYKTYIEPDSSQGKTQQLSSLPVQKKFYEWISNRY